MLSLEDNINACIRQLASMKRSAENSIDGHKHVGELNDQLSRGVIPNQVLATANDVVGGYDEECEVVFACIQAARERLLEARMHIQCANGSITNLFSKEGRAEILVSYAQEGFNDEDKGGKE